MLYNVNALAFLYPKDRGYMWCSCDRHSLLSLLFLEGCVALVESLLPLSSCTVLDQLILHTSCRRIVCVLSLSTFNVEQHGNRENWHP
jgi:hypothetical protein